ncbi:MAG: PEP-CTERM sorting domain-containing protein, partial [Kiritimatiellae bacterium]|nr:PEP-CTERM sorting domain-containing protein [Kiritimatiellia bacterium]
GNLYVQDAWGSASYTAFSEEPAGMDPSFIAVRNDTLAALGYGGWGASDVYQFDASLTASPGFTNVGVSLQNFHGVFRDDTSLFTAGGDTGTGGDHHGLRYLTLDGSVNTIVIDDISVYSCGFAIDADGNLYVGDNDDGRVYRFTAAQLDGAISGSALAITDGEFLWDFGDGGDIGSLAVDGLGRLWAAGWQHDGLKVYNPDLDQEFTYIPGLTNANYKVAAFTHEGEYCVAYLNQANPYSGDTAQYYGYASASEFAIPEPSTLVLAALGLGALWLRRAGHA